MKLKDYRAMKNRQLTILDENISDDRLERLTSRCREVPVDKDSLRFQNQKELNEIIASIKEVMKRDNLASVTANQLGFDARVFGLAWEDTVRVYINPFISDGEGLVLSREECSSLPGREYIIPRRKSITIYYSTPTGQIKSDTFRSVAASVVQQCIELLDGVTLDDLGLECDEDFDNATPEEQQEVINWYIGALELQKEELNTEIENDEVLGGIKKAFDFVEAVANGDIEITTIPEDQKNPEIDYN